MTEVVALRCAACQAPAQEGDVFCEQCGARLLDEEPAAQPDDRIEVDLALAAAISDRGRVHRRNEDAFRLEVAAERAVAAVVCDGISSASAGDTAAQSAANAAGRRLSQALRDLSLDPRAAVSEAIVGAHTAVGEVPWTRRADRDAPSCTLVCALWRDQEVVIASVGDSRAYWVSEGETQLLTTDDSWAEERVAEGSLTRERAMADPRAHTITNWIGPDAPEAEPSLVSLRILRSGRLILCSDGLWNYLTTSSELGGLIDRLPSGASPAAVARSLTETALVRGGRDNITVCVIDIDRRGGR